MEDRHDRTRRALDMAGVRPDNAAGLFDKKIAIHLDERWGNSFDGQMMATLLTNQLSRMCRYLTFVLPDETRLIGCVPQLTTEKYLKRALENLVFEITGSFPSDRQEEYDLVYVIGNTPPAFKPAKPGHTLYLASEGWVGYVSENPIPGHDRPPAEEGNLFGAGVAATLAASEGIKRLMGVSSLPLHAFTAFSAHSLKSSHKEIRLDPGPRLPDKIDFGNLVVCGTGAVGSAFVFLFPGLMYRGKSPAPCPFCEKQKGTCRECGGSRLLAAYLPRSIEGRVFLLDRDFYDITNLNRCLVAGNGQIGKSKALICQEFLRRYFPNEAQLFLSAHLDYEDFVRCLAGTAFVAFESTDSQRLKRDIQHTWWNGNLLVPEYLCSGGTSGFVPTVSNHVAGKTACLQCKMGEPPRLSLQLAATLYQAARKQNLGAFESVEQAEFKLADKKNRLECEHRQRESSPQDYGWNQAAVALSKEYGILGQNYSFDYPMIGDAERALLNLGAGEPFPTIAPVSVFPALIGLGEVVKYACLDGEGMIDSLYDIDLMYLSEKTRPFRIPVAPSCKCQKPEHKEALERRENLLAGNPENLPAFLK